MSSTTSSGSLTSSVLPSSTSVAHHTSKWVQWGKWVLIGGLCGLVLLALLLICCCVLLRRRKKSKQAKHRATEPTSGNYGYHHEQKDPGSHHGTTEPIALPTTNGHSHRNHVASQYRPGTGEMKEQQYAAPAYAPLDSRTAPNHAAPTQPSSGYRGQNYAQNAPQAAPVVHQSYGNAPHGISSNESSHQGQSNAHHATTMGQGTNISGNDASGHVLRYAGEGQDLNVPQQTSQGLGQGSHLAQYDQGLGQVQRLGQGGHLTQHNTLGQGQGQGQRQGGYLPHQTGQHQGHGSFLSQQTNQTQGGGIGQALSHNTNDSYGQHPSSNQSGGAGGFIRNATSNLDDRGQGGNAQHAGRQGGLGGMVSSGQGQHGGGGMMQKAEGYAENRAMRNAAGM